VPTATCTPASPVSPTTPTDPAGTAVLGVQRTRSGHAVSELRRGHRLAPRVLGAGGASVRACLLATQAGPLAGDHDRVRIVVGAGATLVVCPVAATLALPGSGRTRLELDVAVGEGGRLVLEDAPLIVAGGADVVRRTTVALAAGAAAAVRDVVVLGRAGEGAGRLDSALRVTDAAGVVLRDALRIDPATAAEDERVALAVGHRVAGTLCLLGAEPPAADEPAPALARGGALQRATAAGLAELDAELAATWTAWAGALTSTP